MMRIRRPATLCFCLLSLVALHGSTAAQEAAPNPFADFDSFRLANGLKVWYRQLPGATVSSIAIVIPAGFDADPAGREQTAHLLEHVLLSDRQGRSETELVQDLARQGGNYAGLTYADRTIYRVTIPTENAAAGVEWLYGVIAPRPFSEGLIDRNKEPVAVEAGLRPRGFAERLAIRYVHDARLRPRSLWAREFGLRTALDRNVEPYTALEAIRAADVTSFYEKHYTPTTMTLVVVSGMPRSALQPALSATFGMMPWRPAVQAAVTGSTREHETRRFGWWLAPYTSLRLAYRVPTLTGLDHLRLTLIARLLERRLMERLRSGNVKSVYGVSVAVVSRGPATMLRVDANAYPTRETRVRSAIEEEIARITDAKRDSSFYSDRDAVALAMRTRYAAPDALRAIVTDQLYRPDLHDVFPDLGAYLATAGADSIAAFALRTFTADARILQLLRPPPLSLAWLLLFAAAIVALAARAHRALTFRPADMSTIRFVARLRPPRRLARAAGLALFLLIAIRLLAAAAHFAADSWILTIDSPALHLAASALLLFLAVLGLLALAGTIMRKVLVFEHELRIKSLTYRSVIVPGGQIAAVRLQQPVDDADTPLWRHILAGRTPAVVIERKSGEQRRLHVRRPDPLLDAIAALIRRQSQQHALAAEPATPVGAMN